MTAKTADTPTKKPKTSKAATKPKSTTTRAVKAAKPPARIVKAGEKQVPVDKFRKWNLWLGIVLLAEAVAVLTAGGSKTVELTTQYLTKDTLASEAAGNGVYVAAIKHLVDVNLTWIVAGFLLVFAAGLLLAATLWQKKHNAWLVKGVNKLRWAVLGVGGGAIITTIAVLSGVNNVVVLALVFGSVVLAGILAAAVELLGSGRRLRKLLSAGALLGIFLPWLFFALTIAGSIQYGGSVAAYLYYVYATLTLLIIAVCLALYFRVKQRGKWADTAYTEKMFLGLSFAAATLLALQITAGAL